MTRLCDVHTRRGAASNSPKRSCSCGQYARPQHFAPTSSAGRAAFSLLAPAIARVQVRMAESACEPMEEIG
jgi:hypothetical protein